MVDAGGAPVSAGRVAVGLEMTAVVTIGIRVVLGAKNGGDPQPDRRNTNKKILMPCIFM
jgi:hypothetical protein